MLLSIGLEFELIATAREGEPPLPQPANMQLAFINHALLAAGLPIPSPNTVTDPYSMWHTETDASIEETTSGSDTSDGTVGVERFGFQLISPAYLDPVSGIWELEVRGVLHEIGQLTKLRVNSSTGLHIHVGLGKTVTFTLDQLKRLALLYVKHEVIIVGENASQRRLERSQYISPVLGNCLLKGLTLSEVYDHIRAATTIRELCTTINPTENGLGYSRYYHINFTRVVPPEPGERPTVSQPATVEFRLHDGTTSADVALEWAKFVLRFTMYAITTSDEVITSGEAGTWEELCRLVENQPFNIES